MSGPLGCQNFGNLLLALLLTIIYTHHCIHASPIDKINSPESPEKICGDWDVYFNETGKCYVEGSRGPCGELMVVKKAEENLGTGKCDCESECGRRPTIYWPETNRCYYLFSQGPCPEGQWIVPNTEGVPNCENIPCPEKYNGQVKPVDSIVPGITNTTFLQRYVFSYENNCYITNTDNEGPCPEGEKAHFGSAKLPHVCVPAFFCSYALSGVFGRTSCLSGTEPDKYGGCEPQALFD